MNIGISDHAMLRYIERVQGISLAPLREEIRKIVTPPAMAGASTITIDGYTYCLVERSPDLVVVTTILTNEMRQNQYVKNRRKRFGASNDYSGG